MLMHMVTELCSWSKAAGNLAIASLQFATNIIMDLCPLHVVVIYYSFLS